MATIRVKFDGGDVPVLVGAPPTGPDQPIVNPIDTGNVTNTPFIAEAGDYCVTVGSPRAFTPLWQIGQAVDGEQLELTFTVAPAVTA
jgi:hypothetical protein